MTHDVSAITRGNPSREFRGKLKPGITSRMLPRNMKKNSVDRNGSHPSPSGPIICITIWLRTKSIPVSISSWNFPGTIFGFRKAKKNSRMNATNVRVSRKVMKL